MFSEKLLTLCRRQLEEAALIVIAKADLIDEARLDQLRARLAAEFPQAQMHAISPRTGLGLKEWFALLENGAPQRSPCRRKSTTACAPRARRCWAG